MRILSEVCIGPVPKNICDYNCIIGALGMGYRFPCPMFFPKLCISRRGYQEGADACFSVSFRKTLFLFQCLKPSPKYMDLITRLKVVRSSICCRSESC